MEFGMEFGFGIPHRGPLATAAAHRALVAKGEALGYGYASVADHIVVPTTISSTYPYTAGGEFPGSTAASTLEQLTTMGVLVGLTTRLRLLTSVMVLPHRNPILTAKMLATLDVLSGGRIMVGCGVGWMREEFEVLGLPPFEQRGAVSDEYIRAMKVLWTEDAPRFEGRHIRFADITALPHPVQKPHPPFWIGGESVPAMRRAAALGDAWFPTSRNPRFPLDTPERFARAIARMHDMAEKAGRDPTRIAISTSVHWEPDAPKPGDGGRAPFTGSDADVAGDLAAFRAIGVANIGINVAGSGSIAQAEDRLERFMRRIVPLIGSDPQQTR